MFSGKKACKNPVKSRKILDKGWKRRYIYV
jgi:hypothetical protein